MLAHASAGEACGFPWVGEAPCLGWTPTPCLEVKGRLPICLSHLLTLR